MSNPTSFFNRRRLLGRASSPPTWACYEEIISDDDDEDEDDEDDEDDHLDEHEHSDHDNDDDDSNETSCGDTSCSDDAEDYLHHHHHHRRSQRRPLSHHPPLGTRSDSKDSEHTHAPPESPTAHAALRDSHGHDTSHATMSDAEDAGQNRSDDGSPKQRVPAELKKDVKGKQRAVEPDRDAPTGRKSRRRRRHHVETLRPILTIHRSQGFVWNQDLFIPPYIKDRYIASTSPPSSNCFVPSSVASGNHAMTDYDVEVVEIRVGEGELNNIIP